MGTKKTRRKKKQLAATAHTFLRDVVRAGAIAPIDLRM